MIFLVPTFIYMGVNTDPHFGLCPVCETSDGFLNIGRDHLFICHEHKKMWSGGANIFSCWRGENEEIWRANHEKIKEYEQVKPFPDCREEIEAIE